MMAETTMVRVPLREVFGPAFHGETTGWVLRHRDRNLVMDTGYEEFSITDEQVEKWRVR